MTESKKSRMTINQFVKALGGKLIDKRPNSRYETGEYVIESGNWNIFINYGYDDGSVTGWATSIVGRTCFSETYNLTDMYQHILEWHNNL